MIRENLNAVRTTRDIGKLFTTIGYVEKDLPFSGDVLIVARWKSFKVVAAEKENALEGVRELARELASAAECGIAAAVSRDSELAIAAPMYGRPGITRVLVVSLDDPSRFALEQIERLSPRQRATVLQHALSVGEVLSSEAAGERFFKEFRTHLERMATSIDGRRSAADKRMVALLCLSRILFLYFVQAKGWLDGRPDYLKRQLDTALERGENFHRTVLQPLFFDTLNQPPERRSNNPVPGNIPYLNGGLFEPHPAERRIGPTHFPNDIWRDAFDELFERFRFTVRENDEVDAIAPDMLGRVFERLMNADERHETGTFYTPESVVRQVATASIETALEQHLTRSVVRRLVAGVPVAEDDKPLPRRILGQLKVLDPAVGSGAFLLGVLHVLSQMWFALEPGLGWGERLKRRKKILRDNLFGVDLNPVAVRLAELRLWLAVIADDPTTDINRVAPLPNLDGVVRQGDTLLDPVGAARSFGLNTSYCSGSAADSVRTARSELFTARGRNRQAVTRRLRGFELEVANGLLETALDNAQHATKDLTESAKSRDLFGKRIGLSASQRQRLQTLIRVRRDLRKARRQLTDGSLPFFSFEVHAPDILSRGGFDVVVGNPPWVRAEQIPQSMRKVLGARFAWWRTTGRVGYSHLPDLSVAFLERCLELTRNGGVVGLLLPSKITSAGYGETMRRGLVSETTIEYVHRVSEHDSARFGATTYPLALVVKQDKASPRHHVHLGFETTETVHQASLDTPGPWILLASRSRDALEEFRLAGKPLGEISPPMLGVKTGADRLYLGRIVEESNSLAEVAFKDRQVALEQTLLRPVLRGRDVRRFCSQPSGVIIWCYDGDGAPLRSLPVNASNYFEQCARAAQMRSDYRGGPVWAVFRTRCALEDHRVVWPDIVQRPRAVVLEETRTPSAIPLNTCYVAAAPDRETALVVAAVLNSLWAAAFFTANADEARGGYRRINARVAQLLPVPQPGSSHAQLAELSKRVHENEGFKEEDLDSAVADALGLSKQTQDVLRSLVDDSS